MSRPAVWGSGITWGSFTWGETTTTGLPVLYVAIDGEAVGEAYAARFRLGRSAWFDVLSPNTASVELIGDVAGVEPNSEIILSCGAGMLWKGYVDSSTARYSNGNDWRTTIQATDVVGRLGRSIKAPVRVEASGDLVAREFPIGFAGDPASPNTLYEVAVYYLGQYAPGLSIDVELGTSTGTLPELTDWTFDAPGPMPRKTVLELLNKAEQSSNAMMAIQPDGTLLVVPRAPSGLSSTAMAEIGDGEQVWTRGRDTVVNRWLLERPAYNDTTVLDATDTTSRDLYGEQAYEVQDFLCATATHFPSAFRDALADPRWTATYTRTVGDLSSPWLLLAPLAWAYDSGRDWTWQVMSVEHDVTPGEWRVTVAVDASQDALNGEAEPTPA